MVKLWRRYKPFINAGIQELITYRVNFLLYRIGDVMGAFVAFYLWKAVFDSSQESLIQGFSMTDPRHPLLRRDGRRYCGAYGDLADASLDRKSVV